MVPATPGGKKKASVSSAVALAPIVASVEGEREKRESEVERAMVEEELRVVQEEGEEEEQVAKVVVDGKEMLETGEDELDEEEDEEGDSEAPDALVEHLFDVIKDLRVKVRLV
jgi:hypothetical protein